MNKKILSFSLVVIMLLSMILPIGTAFAAVEPTITVKTNSVTMNTTDVYTLSQTQGFSISTSHSSGISYIAYKFDNNAVQYLYSSGQQIIIPSSCKDGNKHYFDIQVKAADGTYSKWYSYMFKIVTVEPTVTAKAGNITMTPNTEYTLTSTQSISVLTSHSSGISYIAYKFDNDAVQYLYSSGQQFTIPAKCKDGNYHYLDVQVKAADGTYSKWYSYKFKTTTQVEIVPTVEVKAGNTIMNTTNIYTLQVTQSLLLTASHNKGISRIEYNFDNDATQYVSASSQYIAIPSKCADGNNHTLDVRALSADGTYSKWYVYKLRTTNTSTNVEPTVVASTNNTTINENQIYNLESTQSIFVTTSHSSGISYIAYKFDNDAIQYIYSPGQKLTIPGKYQDGNVHYLDVQVKAADGTYSRWYSYMFRYYTASTVLPKVEVTTQGENSTIVLNTIDRYVLSGNQSFVVKATHDSGIKSIQYKFDNDAITTLNASTVTISIPAKYQDGNLHYLDVKAEANDGTSSGWLTYLFKIKDGNTVYPFILFNDEKFNTSLSTLAIALRNVPVSTKTGNKNFYELNENVQYNIDFVNAGSEITEKVYIDFVIPAGFTVTFIDAQGGVLINSNTLRWTFDGLKQDEKGTIPVILRYTGIPSYSSSIVKPYAIIKSNILTDSSAVCNLIFENSNTKVTTNHEPFMIGDAGTNTFRPNEGLNRAEMAMVLVRIFDLPLVNVNTITYTDANVIEENQYRWAKQAIMTVTQYGLMEGYNDGSFRPGEKVTKAQLITILARKFAVDGGTSTTTNAFAIKTNPIKWFNNLSPVYANYGYDNHWAAQYLAQMIRLNMLPDFTNTIDGNLDLIISRADTAKLLCTILYRGPSVDGTNSSLTTTFVDVNSYTQNYNYILEASAPIHNSRFTTNGTEIMVK